MSQQRLPGCKLVVVGDSAVGKTTMLYSYSGLGKLPESYTGLPPWEPNYLETAVADGRKVTLELCDSAGQEDYDRLRPLGYANANAFFICFSVASRSSLEHVVSKWVPEVTQHCPKAILYLCATKCDLRGTDKEQVTRQEGEELARQIHAQKYFETSGLAYVGLVEAFDCALEEHAAAQSASFSLFARIVKFFKGE